jgi:hypothetical protein
MSGSRKVYLVGNAEAPKTNQWDAMTNNADEAQRLKAPIEGGVIREITVSPPRGGKR